MSSRLSFIRAVATSAMLVSASPLAAATNETPPDLSSLVATWTAPPPSFPGNSRCSTGAVLLGNGSMAACLGGPADKLRLYLARNDFWRLSNSTAGMQKLAAVLDLQVPGLAGASYRIDQTIRDGTLRGVFTKGSLTVRLTGWLAATDDLLVIELLAEGGETAVDVTLTSPGEPPSRTESGVQDATVWVTRKFSEQVEIPTEAATALRLFGAAALRFDLKPGAPVTMAVATTSAFREPKPLDAAKNRVTSLNAAAIRDARAAHERWWQDYWNQSWVELHDPDLMKGYYQGLYTLAACSRDPKFPPGLFGTWITVDHPNWSNDYHLNYNFVAPFYGLCSANRLAQADPQDAPLIDFMPRGRWYAENVTKTRGVLYPVGIGPLGIEVTRGERFGIERGSNEQGGCFHHQRSNAAYSLVNIAQRWRCTRDPAYARKVYPFTVAVADFWEDYLKPVNGKYEIHGDAIHELSGANKNPVLTLGLLRNSFDLVIDLSETLGADAQRRDKWRHILANLADFPVQERDGKTVFRYTSEGPAWWDGNTLGIQHIYPGNAITLDSDPQWLAIARNTLAAMNRWQDGNGSNSFFPAAARLGTDPSVILDQLRTYVRDTYPNGFRAGNVHGIENCGTVHNTVNEMLCMSVGHVLRVFPVWPKDKEASFANLRAWDAFLVSADWKNGTTGKVRIVSERGRPCHLQNPWPGRQVTLTRDNHRAETLTGERLTIPTKDGEVIELSPAGP